MPCWMLRRTSFAGQHVTNVAKLGRIPASAAMNGRRTTTSREVNLKVPKLRRQTFETATSSNATGGGRARSRRR